ncbi:MAG: ATP-grasp domain-containing protein [Clostridia bacterium]|nr:ATP-grasp domain-containing protein [Clostridia bacterium]
METLDCDVPLPKPKIGIIYNLKKGIHGATVDAEAEYDSIDTVNAIKKVFEKRGYSVSLYEADKSLADKLLQADIDIAFNIAEGINGRGREAQVPAILSMYSIPYTGSDETALSVALDKHLTKKLFGAYRIRSPKGVVITDVKNLSAKGLNFPLILKPNAEGSSKGISDKCVVYNQTELKSKIEHLVPLYGDILAEEYIDGREFTVGILGNGKDIRVFRPMEIIFDVMPDDNHKIYSYFVKQNYLKYIKYTCFSDIGDEILAEMSEIAEKAYRVLECKDFARVDFRVDNQGKVYFIEINPLPGLAPDYSDYPMLAGFNGMEYDDLVMSVLSCGARRYGITIL